MSRFVAYDSGKKSSGSRKKSSTSRKKSSTPPAPVEKLNNIRKGKSNVKGMSLKRTGKTSFILTKGKRPNCTALPLNSNTRTSSSPSTEIVRTTTPEGNTHISISPKSHGRSIYSRASDTDKEVTSILNKHSSIHNSILSKTSPPIIGGHSFDDEGEESFNKTPVLPEHLTNRTKIPNEWKKKHNYESDDDDLLRGVTPLENWPITPAERDLLEQEQNRKMFVFSPDDKLNPIPDNLQNTDMDEWLERTYSEIEKTENERKKVREEERRLEDRLDKLNKMVRDQVKRKKSKGRKKGKGAGSSKLHDIINRLKF